MKLQNGEILGILYSLRSFCSRLRQILITPGLLLNCLQIRENIYDIICSNWTITSMKEVLLLFTLRDIHTFINCISEYKRNHVHIDIISDLLILKIKSITKLVDNNINNSILQLTG